MFQHPANLLPDFFSSSAGSGGAGDNARLSEFPHNALHRVVQLIARKSVTLGCDDEEWTAAGGEEVKKMLIARLGWNIDVHQHQTQGQSRTSGDVGLYKARPLAGYLPRDLGIAVGG